jgi:hypothetical protein
MKKWLKRPNGPRTRRRTRTAVLKENRVDPRERLALLAVSRCASVLSR